MRRLCSLIVIVALLTPSGFAWGPEGHRIIADVAREHVSAKARRALVELLGDDDLAAISSWADDIRRERPETFGWHFVDIPSSANGFDEARDCYHPSRRSVESRADRHNCIVDRITLFEQVLADRNASRSERLEALKFLVHFVADIHQPLHAMAEARGGNEIHVIQFGSASCGRRNCELHGTWDFGMIAHAGLRERDYVARLNDVISRQNLESRAGGTPEVWANESFHLAHDVWVQDGGIVDESYYQRNLEVLDERLALAGLRLARVLNESLGK